MIRVEAPAVPLDQWSVLAVTGAHSEENNKYNKGTKKL